MSVPISDAIAFALAMAAGQFSPGPDLLLILKNSIAHRRAAALSTVLGTSLGIVIHTTVVITGLAAFSEQFPRLLQIVWLAGAGYLAWLGVRLLVGALKTPDDTSAGDAALRATIVQGDCLKAFSQGFVTNITNPKVFIFFTTMLAASLPPGSSQDRRLLFGAIIIAEALVLWSLFVIFLQWEPIARLYGKSVRWINGTFGVLLLWIAGSVLWHSDLT